VQRQVQADLQRSSGILQGESLSLNATPKPRGKGPRQGVSQLPLSPSLFSSSLIPGYMAVLCQGWPSAQAAGPLGGEEGGCRACGTAQEREQCYHILCEEHKRQF